MHAALTALLEPKEQYGLFRAVSLIFGTDLWFFGSDNA